jgi:predicted CoA-binding protein
VDDEVITRVLKGMRTWAVVGASPSPYRDSSRIAALLKARGYRVIPVNPNCDSVLGERSYPTVADIPQSVDVVDIFRRSEEAGKHVDEAIAIGAKAVWMQLGVLDHEAAERARAAGLDVVMDRCPAIELPRLGIGGYSGAAV